LGLVWTTWRFLPQGEQQAKVHASGGNPIKHVVFIIKENHSFDNYFGRFPGAHGATTGLAKVNGVQQTITLAPIVDQPDDYCHVKICYVKDYDHGAMDSFNLSKPCNTPPYGCYTAATQDQIPNYWAYATKYVLSDETYAP